MKGIERHLTLTIVVYLEEGKRNYYETSCQLCPCNDVKHHADGVLGSIQSALVIDDPVPHECLLSNVHHGVSKANPSH